MYTNGESDTVPFVSENFQGEKSNFKQHQVIHHIFVVSTSIVVMCPMIDYNRWSVVWYINYDDLL